MAPSNTAVLKKPGILLQVYESCGPCYVSEKIRVCYTIPINSLSSTRLRKQLDGHLYVSACDSLLKVTRALHKRKPTAARQFLTRKTSLSGICTYLRITQAFSSGACLRQRQCRRCAPPANCCASPRLLLVLLLHQTVVAAATCK